MAGSPIHVLSPPDPILAARLEALQLLAEGSTDRIMVIGPDQTIIYANQAAWSGAGQTGPPTRPAKCYEAFLRQSDPCAVCSAKKVFDATDVRAVSCSTGGDGNACGMKQAYPLMAGDQRAGAVLVLLSGAGPAVAGRPDQAGHLIGQSAPMQQLLEMITLVADSQATVLLQGESGTGKELAARTIHRLSYRRDNPFVVVDCGALPETLLESELFGHVKGAFTGAHATKKGLFEAATGGTIFLDEIADTSPQFQAKLLRVLQEGEVKPVGTHQTRHCNVRIIAASYQPLLKLVEQGSFRRDLYFRLRGFEVNIPPLRERVEDIAVLAEYAARKYADTIRRRIAGISAEVMERLKAHPYPGNVRELENEVRRMVALADDGEFLGVNLMSPEFATLVPCQAKDVHSKLLEKPGTLKDKVESIETFLVSQSLNRHKWNQSRAAIELGLSRVGLANKIKRYRLDETGA